MSVRPLRPLLLVACLVLGFGAARVAVGALTGAQAGWGIPVEMMDQPLRCFAQGAGAFDTLFLGSSLTKRHVDPQAVADAAAQAGVTLRPFNMGIQGFTIFEQQALLEHLLEDGPPPGLETVVIEIRPIALLGWENAFSDRAQRLATPSRALRAIGFQLGGDERLKKRLARALPYAAGLAAAELGVGSLARALVPDLEPPRPACGDGAFLPLTGEEQDPELKARRDAFLAGGWDGADPPEPLDAPHPLWIEHYRGLVQLVRDAGLRCVIYLPPSDIQLDLLRELEAVSAQAFDGAPVISFLPEQLGHDLYARELRFDREHLLRPSTVTLSRRMGAALADVLQSEGR